MDDPLPPEQQINYATLFNYYLAKGYLPAQLFTDDYNVLYEHRPRPFPESITLPQLSKILGKAWGKVPEECLEHTIYEDGKERMKWRLPTTAGVGSGSSEEWEFDLDTVIQEVVGLVREQYGDEEGNDGVDWAAKSQELIKAMHEDEEGVIKEILSLRKTNREMEEKIHLQANKLAELRDEIDGEKKASGDFAGQLDKVEMKELAEDCKNFKASMFANADENAGLRDDLEKETSLKQGLQTELDVLKSRHQTLSEAYGKLETDIRSGESSKTFPLLSRLKQEVDLKQVLQTELNALQSRHKALSEAYCKVKNQLSSQSSQAVLQNAELQSLRGKLFEREAGIRTLAKNEEMMRTILDGLRGELEKMTKTVESVMSENEILEKEVMEAKSEIEMWKKRPSSSIKRALVDNDGDSTEQKLLETKAVPLEQALQDSETQRKTETQSFRTKIDLLLENLKDSETDRSLLERSNRGLKASLTGCQNSNTELTARIDRRDKSIQALETRIHQLEETIPNLQFEKKETEEKIAGFEKGGGGESRMQREWWAHTHAYGPGGKE